LGNYSGAGGTSTKRRLLDWEGALQDLNERSSKRWTGRQVDLWPSAAMLRRRHHDDSSCCDLPGHRDPHGSSMDLAHLTSPSISCGETRDDRDLSAFLSAHGLAPSFSPMRWPSTRSGLEGT